MSKVHRIVNSHLQQVLLIAVLTLASEVSAQPDRGERFENTTAGIALTRPPGWHTVSLETVQKNREKVRLPDKELEQALQTRATAPLFAFMKYPEPHPTLNPSIQITLRPLGGLAASRPAAIMKMALGPMQSNFPDFVLERPIADVRVSGLPAAHARATYTLTTDAGQFKVRTRIWVVTRGPFMFLIGMSGPAGGPDMSEMEFATALASIQIEK